MVQTHTQTQTQRENITYSAFYNIQQPATHRIEEWRVNRRKQMLTDWHALSVYLLVSFSACHYFYSKTEHFELALWYVTRSCNDARRRRRNDIDDNHIRYEKHVKFCLLPYHEHMHIHPYIQFNCSFARSNSIHTHHQMHSITKHQRCCCYTFFRYSEINVRFIRFEYVKLWKWEEKQTEQRALRSANHFVLFLKLWWVR